MKKNRQKSQKYQKKKNIVHTVYRRPIETEPFSIKSILFCFVDGEIHEVSPVPIVKNQQKKTIYIHRKLTYLTMSLLIDMFLLVGMT